METASISKLTVINKAVCCFLSINHLMRILSSNQIRMNEKPAAENLRHRPGFHLNQFSFFAASLISARYSSIVALMASGVGVQEAAIRLVSLERKTTDPRATAGT